MSKKEHTIRIATETALQSWARDASSFALFTALIGVGVYLDSSAMQWAGFMCAVIILANQGMKLVPKLTITEAREYLDKLEADTP